ncbi:uncharacterized protein LOC126790070 [Argentina anserina]|uniref:uncharacterized protein LOC126790070 n=1 Tax=Argentina anserina TaxID=57926 RepID=UPI0021763E93|nr:uncharacterized protein LOC126790070 [Potentilla anserina]
MASFSIEEFVGNGVLKGLIPKLLEEGWDDVPTLKIMNLEDMDAINMTQQQKDALEIRSYLHERALVQYGDALESSGKSLPEILTLGAADLSSEFGMKRGHIARFKDRTGPSSACVDDPKADPSPATKSISTHSKNNSIYKSFQSVNSRKVPSRATSYTEKTLEQSLASFKIKDGYIFKGIVAMEPAEPRACGCVQPPAVTDKIAPYSAIESISVQKLTPEYKIGMEHLVKTKTPPMKSAELWRNKPAVLLCIRRPGCIMCRAEAHQLYAKKPLFDALGVQLFAVLHEYKESEVRELWPRYWGGAVIYDRGMDFFKALGGGKLLKEKFLSGFVFNPRAIANYKRAKAMGIQQNFRGEGEIKGGLFIVGSGKSGIAYQFIERNFGDWAPIAEVLDICTQLQNHQESQEESSKTSSQFK